MEPKSLVLELQKMISEISHKGIESKIHKLMWVIKGKRILKLKWETIDNKI